MQEITEDMVKQVEDETIQEEPKESPKKEKSIYELLAEYPGAPSQPKIDTWKTEFRDIYLFGVSDDEIFIFRPIKRKEWNVLQTKAMQIQQQYQQKLQMAQQQGKPEPELPQMDFIEENVVKTCILWGSGDAYFALDDRGGVLSNLFEQIMQRSHFMDPQAASNFVIKL